MLEREQSGRFRPKNLEPAVLHVSVLAVSWLGAVLTLTVLGREPWAAFAQFAFLASLPVCGTVLYRRLARQAADLAARNQAALTQMESRVAVKLDAATRAFERAVSVGFKDLADQAAGQEKRSSLRLEGATKSVGALSQAMSRHQASYDQAMSRHQASLDKTQAAVGELAKKTETLPGKTFQLLESLAGVVATTRPTIPYPPARSWGARPEFLNDVVESIVVRRPELVVEFGSGVSTLATAYALRQNGNGRLVTFESSEDYAAVTRERLQAHGLTEVVEVVVAPLEPVQLGGSIWKWYDTTRLETLHDVDMIIVNGPPFMAASLARYPALPLVMPKAKADLIVHIDEQGRPGDGEVVERWAAEYPGLTVNTLQSGASTASRTLRSRAPNRLSASRDDV